MITYPRLPRPTGRAFAPLFLFLVACASSPEATEPLHVIVLHTNDVHGQVLPREASWMRVDEPPLVGGIPRVAAYVNAVREEARREGAALFVVDAGDWYQGTPEGQIERGLKVLRALDEVGYDALAVGNHELDHGVAHLEGLLEATDLVAVCANVMDPRTGQRVAWGEPWTIVERQGLRVAFVGLLATETPQITHPDTRALTFVDPAETFEAVRRELEDQDVDWIVPLTHIGLRADTALARAHPELALIIGGHSHTFLEEGWTEGETVICQVGSKASAVGRVDLFIDRETGAIEGLRERAITLDKPFPENFRNARVEKICDELVLESEERMNVVVGELAIALTRGSGTRSSPAGNLVADVCRESTGADVALMNRGGIRRNVPAGPVTRRDVFELLPFDNHLVTVSLTGKELSECLRRAVEDETHSGVEVSGMIVEYLETENGPRFIGGTIGGEQLEEDRTYTVTVNSFMAQGGDDFLAPDAGSARVEHPAYMRDVFEQRLIEEGSVTASDEQRYKDVTR
jgi:2',3'-cyclic-nucleotide 2'-phosphodiesterase (5'-nucleotidase family)